MRSSYRAPAEAGVAAPTAGGSVSTGAVHRSAGPARSPVFSAAVLSADVGGEPPSAAPTAAAGGGPASAGSADGPADVDHSGADSLSAHPAAGGMSAAVAEHSVAATSSAAVLPPPTSAA